MSNKYTVFTKVKKDLKTYFLVQEVEARNRSLAKLESDKREFAQNVSGRRYYKESKQIILDGWHPYWDNGSYYTIGRVLHIIYSTFGWEKYTITKFSVWMKIGSKDIAERWNR